MRGSGLLYDPWSLAACERVHVRRVLIEARWDKTKAAQLLKVSRRALYRLMERHQIKEQV